MYNSCLFFSGYHELLIVYLRNQILYKVPHSFTHHGHGQYMHHSNCPGQESCPLQRLLRCLEKILHFLLCLLGNLLHLILRLAHIIRSRDFLLLHILQALVHSSARITHRAGCFLERRFCALHCPFSGFFRWRRDWDVKLEAVVGIWLRC